MGQHSQLAQDEHLKAAIVEPLGGHAGMNFYDIELARGLHGAGVSCRLYTCDETHELSDADVTILKPFKTIFGNDPLAVRGWRFLKGLLWSAGDVLRHNIPVVHIHCFQYGLREVATCLLFRVLGRKVITTAHDIKPFSKRESLRGFRYVMSLTNHVIVHNEHSAQLLSQQADGEIALPSVSIIRHGNYIDRVASVDKEEAKRSLGLPEQQPILLFFGQIKPEKGLEELLRAFARHKQDGARGFLLVAGRPVTNAKEDYRQIAADLDLDDHVRFDFRYVPDEEASLCYSAADIVVLPYREIYQSGVLLMAMSHARAVLCSDLPPMYELVEEGTTGFIFRSGDQASLTAAIGRALGDLNLLASMGRNGARLMKEGYNWQDIGQQTAAVYRATLEA